jgi:hypothetical protein
MATLPSTNPEERGDLHVLRRRPARPQQADSSPPPPTQPGRAKIGLMLILLSFAVVLMIRGLPERRSIRWLPSEVDGTILLAVRDGYFAREKYLPLHWQFTRDYDERGEMAWCTRINGKWQKVFPFGEDGDQVQFRPEWLRPTTYSSEPTFTQQLEAIKN